MISLDFKSLKTGFFDRKAVMDALDRANYQALKQYGLAVRRRAMASLKYGKTPSTPGTPPTAHRSYNIRKKRKDGSYGRVRNVSLLREYLYSVYDPRTRSVVVGPAKLNGAESRTVLKSLEFGGPSMIVTVGRRRLANYPARPFMGPAGRAEAPGLPPRWRDSVR